MENDTVRSMGESTLVDVWINGKMRSICVSRGAIEGFLKLAPDASAKMSEDERREFVRTHLAIVVAAAKERLTGGANSESILIDTGQLGPGEKGKAFVERRRGGDRRKGDRRGGEPAKGGRRQSDRRS